MPGNRELHLRLLPSLEQEVLEPSNALVAATELAAKLGLGKDVYAILADRLSELDEGHAELAWRTIGDMNELLGVLSIDMSAPETGEGA